MSPVLLVRLGDLMKLGSGRPETTAALIDCPVARDLSDLVAATIREIPGKLTRTCARSATVACTHGTFVAGMLSARRGSVAPAICPGCTLLRPSFAETAKGNGQMPSANPEERAEALTDSVDTGARVINLSSALIRPSPEGESKLRRPSIRWPNAALLLWPQRAINGPWAAPPSPATCGWFRWPPVLIKANHYTNRIWDAQPAEGAERVEREHF
jgi:hypothetical protein